jgi:hypothetical protein
LVVESCQKAYDSGVHDYRFLWRPQMRSRRFISRYRGPIRGIHLTKPCGGVIVEKGEDGKKKYEEYIRRERLKSLKYHRSLRKARTSPCLAWSKRPKVRLSRFTVVHRHNSPFPLRAGRFSSPLKRKYKAHPRPRRWRRWKR